MIWHAIVNSARSGRSPTVICALLVALVLTPSQVLASGVILKNGTELEGAMGEVSTMVPALANAEPADGGAKIIRFIDDDLRRTYFSFNQINQIVEAASPPDQKFVVPNKPAGGGNPVRGLGAFVKRPTELNQWGQRTITIMLAEGPADITQGVTLITPRYYQLKTLPGGRQLLLDQRYATSNLTDEQLLSILTFATKDQKPEARKSVVQLLLQADRHSAAKKELETLMKTYPQMEGLSEMLRELQQFRARRTLEELRRRQDAGQVDLVRRTLEKFPKEGVEGQILLQVREMIGQDLDTQQQMEALRTDLKQRLDKIKDTALRQQLAPLIAEMCNELNLANLPRFSAYRRLSTDTATSDADKLALAVSGWLLGTDDAIPNIRRSQSLIVVRGYIREFLDEPLKTSRDALLGHIRSQEAGTPELVARLLSAMKPVGALPEPVENRPGYFEMTVAGRDKQPDTTYVVQLPPEYDPYRRYPAVVTLHGQTTTPSQQIDWWAGVANKMTGQRSGQATRQGYIVIAPQWGQEGQRQYDFTAREHAAVLNALRDACRKFAVDTDRVYLTGHAIGGDAAWDLALAHPDLWAGVVPIVATADTSRYNYLKLYWQNAQYVPFYFVGGEYDGAKRAKNGALLDRYLRSMKYDTMVVEFLGRGHENFSDEVVRIFDWMRRHKRNFFPKDFECAALRSYDNFFWWVEINKFQRGVTVDPEEWPGRGTRTQKISGKIGVTKDFTMVTAGTGKANTTVWLAPELVDFSKRIRVSLSGRPEVTNVRPNVSVILEDARTRGDRQHPFWARVDFP